MPDPHPDLEREARRNVNSYDVNARLPVPGSVYVWELDKPGARELIEVIEVLWNGEEWWVRTKNLLHPSLPSYLGFLRTTLNDISRFWEAVTPVRELHGVENVRRAALDKSAKRER